MITKKAEKKLKVEFSRVYDDYRKGLLRHAYLKVNNYSTSLDLVQDTFMKAWDYLKKGEEIHTMKAFLYRVLNNLIIDQYRKHKTISLDSLLEEGYEPVEQNPKDLGEVLDAKAVFPLIDRLPEKYQEVMKMRYVEDLSLKEMSAITHESKNAISIKVHRGVEKLRLMYVH